MECSNRRHKAATCILFAVVSLILAAPANAAYFHHEDDTSAGRWRRAASTAQVPLPDASVLVREHPAGEPIAECGGSARIFGCTVPTAVRAYTVDLSMTSDARSTFLHEVGHVFDNAEMDDADRSRFQQIDGSRATPWAGGDDTARPSEDFANAYAACAMLGPRPRTTAGLVIVEALPYVRTIYQYRAACRMITAAAQR